MLLSPSARSISGKEDGTRGASPASIRTRFPNAFNFYDHVPALLDSSLSHVLCLGVFRKLYFPNKSTANKRPQTSPACSTSAHLRAAARAQLALLRAVAVLAYHGVVHDGVPRLPRGGAHQQHHGRAKRAKVHARCERLAVLHLACALAFQAPPNAPLSPRQTVPGDCGGRAGGGPVTQFVGGAGSGVKLRVVVGFSAQRRSDVISHRDWFISPTQFSVASYNLERDVLGTGTPKVTRNAGGDRTLHCASRYVILFSDMPSCLGRDLCARTKQVHPQDGVNHHDQYHQPSHIR